MTAFTPKELKDLRNTLQAHLDLADFNRTINLPNQTGITIDVGNCSYNGGEATFKVKLTKEGAVSQEAELLERYAGMYGIDPTRIGTINGQGVTLQGYNIKARKMPWMVGSLTTDSKWKLTQVQAVSMFGKISEKV